MGYMSQVNIMAKGSSENKPKRITTYGKLICMNLCCIRDTKSCGA